MVTICLTDLESYPAVGATVITWQVSSASDWPKLSTDYAAARYIRSIAFSELHQFEPAAVGKVMALQQGPSCLHIDANSRVFNGFVKPEQLPDCPQRLRKLSSFRLEIVASTSGEKCTTKGSVSARLGFSLSTHTLTL